MNKIRNIFIAVFLVASFVIPIHYIEAKTDTTTQSTAQRIKYKKRTKIDFSDIYIKGELKRPTGFLIFRRGGRKFRGLIKIRENFDKNLKKSIKKINW